MGVDYARFSSDKQESIPEQQGINKEVAATHDLTLVASFIDPDISRDLADRPGLSEMVAYLEDHPEVGFIVVNELERLTAGVSQRSHIVELCQRLSLTIITEDMGAIDPFDDDKMHRADERAVAAKGEVLKIRRRVRRNLRQKVINGTVAMRPAYGTRMKPLHLSDGTILPSGARYVDPSGRVVRSGELEVHPDELPWLKAIFEWADTGLSYEAIARRLTEAGVPTKSGNSAWRGTSVRGIVTNPLYKGQMTWGLQATKRYGNGKKYLEVRPEDDPGRVTKPSPLGALISPEVWDRVNGRRATVTERTKGSRKYGRQLLDDLVSCGRCGHKMYGRNDNAGSRNAHRQNVIWRYFCYSARPGYETAEGYTSTCPTIQTMSEKKILKALLVTLRDGQPGLATLSYEPSGLDAVALRRQLTRELEQTQKEFERGSRLVIMGSIAETVWDEMRPEIEKRRARLTEQLQGLECSDEKPLKLEPTTTARLAELVELLGDRGLPVEDRRDALDRSGLIRRIYVDSPTVRVEVGSGLKSGLLSS